ncbi:amidohydrolase [Candidatus Pseudomonas adelgestsugas]|nr:amidohydrolase [Candidatus Pseudomonas adelgestsugas]
MHDLSTLPNLNIALVQTILMWHDRQANLKHFELLLEQTKDADLIVLPEMFTTGFSMASKTLAEPENGPTYQWLQVQAAKYNAVITGSVIIHVADGSHRNRLLWAQPNGEVLHYDKRHLFRMAGELNYYTPGEYQMLFELNGWRIRPLICYDLRFPVWSYDIHHTDLLLYIANWPGVRRHHWNRLLPARAIENLCYVAALNRVGTDGNGLTYTGDSQILDFQGDTLLNAGNAEVVFSSCLNAVELAKYRIRFPVKLDADKFQLL